VNEVVLVLVSTSEVLAFLYTCASVAIVVALFPASVDLLGTTGEVENVLVPAIVWFQLVFTQSEVLGTAHQSFITFHVVQSNTAKCQLVAEDGQVTSPDHSHVMAALTAPEVMRFVLEAVTEESTGIVATPFDTMLVVFIFTSSTGNS
jgi:hypothetical protein